MTNFEPAAPSQPHAPETRPVGSSGTRRIASFDNYPAAQHLVDRMSDAGFPVEHLRIVGDEVRTVEQITGRMTNARSALAGAAGGAWFGLLLGLLFGLFTSGPVAWIWVLVTTVLIGALWGAVFGFVAHWSTGGRRDFSSVQSLEAKRYDIYVSESHAAEAERFVSGG